MENKLKDLQVVQAKLVLEEVVPQWKAPVAEVEVARALPLETLSRNLNLLFVTFGKIDLWLILYSGREFGTTSLEIHLKACKKKWEVE